MHNAIHFNAAVSVAQLEVAVDRNLETASRQISQKEDYESKQIMDSYSATNDHGDPNKPVARVLGGNVQSKSKSSFEKGQVDSLRNLGEGTVDRS